MTESIEDDTPRLAYLAGIIDGEGTIYIRLAKPSGQLRLRLQVVNTNKTLMSWLTDNFCGHVNLNRRSGGHKDCYTWYESGDKAVALLKKVKPYLVIKAPQTSLGIEAWDMRQPTPLVGRRSGISTELRAIRQSYVDAMHLLNKKGKEEGSLNEAWEA